MPEHPVYLFNNKQYVLTPDGPNHWAVCRNPQFAGRRVRADDVGQTFVRDGNVVITEADFIDHARQRHARATALHTSYFNQANAFQPMTAQHVTYLLEAEFVNALAAREENRNPDRDGVLSTAENTAREKLNVFLNHTGWAITRFAEQQNPYYRYSLEDNFVGETAHIRGCATLYNEVSSNVRYRCTTQQPSQRFTAFMAAVPTYEAGEADAKTHMNETLLAPRTVENPVAVHQRIYRSFVEPLSAQRKQELAQWVTAPFAGGQPTVRVGIWVRYLAAEGGHTTDQNMTRERFQRILQAAVAAGVQEVIIVGDGWPAQENWLAGTGFSTDPAPNERRAHVRFLRMWQQNGGIQNGQHGVAPHIRGYGEQALVYSMLYRDPSANDNVGMSCIITNKSGGPDLPSLAGVPQIQIAEMAAPEIMIHHRMGFQAICSPMWTVLRAGQRQQNELMTLSEEQTGTLTTLIRRAQVLRTWHLGVLGVDRYDW